VTPPPVRPPAPKPKKSLKRAILLNFFFPGAGVVYVGRRVSGLLLSFAFAVCLAAALIIFMIGYAQYISLAVSGEILQGNNLETIPSLFHTPWLIGLLFLSVIILIISMIALFGARKPRV